MPKLETALVSYLKDDANLTGLIAGRVTWQRLPEKQTLPAISCARTSARRIYTYDTFEETDAWTTARVQIDCWGRSAEEAIEVGEAVLMALSGYGGDMSGEYIGSSFAADEIDLYDVPTQLYRRVLDFEISYEDELEGAS